VRYSRIAAVAGVLFFAAILIWLYGVKTSVIWAAAMAAFLLILWAATIPLRRRQRRVWLEMGLGPDGRPLPDEEEDRPSDDAGAGDEAGAPGADDEAGHPRELP
jgi:hypothetical protein